MEIKDIRSELQKLSALVGGWDTQNQITTVERDIVLEKLRALYEAVRFCEAVGVDIEAAEKEIVVEIDLGEVLSLDADPEETQPEAAREPAPVAEPAAEPAAAPQFESASGALFDVEVESGHRRRQRVIMSLYNTEEKGPQPAAPAEEPASAETPAGEPVPVELSEDELVEVFTAETVADMIEPIEEEHVIEIVQPDPEIIAVEVERKFEAEMTPTGLVLGDVMNHDVQTLSDSITPPRDMASELRRQEPVADLHRAVGINDKFLMIRDLFEGNGKAYDKALDKLNCFDDLDDCMIYIAENYAWNPNSDGAKLLMDLLERKFA